MQSKKAILKLKITFILLLIYIKTLSCFILYELFWIVWYLISYFLVQPLTLQDGFGHLKQFVVLSIAY